MKVFKSRNTSHICLSSDRAQGGFTLTELVVATAIVSLLLVMVMTFLTNTVVDSQRKSARSDILRDAQAALDTIGNDIQLSSGADEVNRWPDDHSPGAPTDPYSWVSDADTLVLASPALNASDELIYLDPFAYITYKNNLVYFVENNVLYRRTLAANVADNKAVTSCPDGVLGCPADSIRISNVDSIGFEYLDENNANVDPSAARSIKVTLTIADNVFGQDISLTESLQMVFRNE